MRCLRPRAPGVGEGHHDLHAADEVHVHQHDDLRTSQQETQSCLADVKLALLRSPAATNPVITVTRMKKSQVLSSARKTNSIKISIKTFLRFTLIVK